MSNEESTDSIDELDPALLLEQAAAAKEAGEDIIAAKIYNTVGNLYMSVAEYDEALENFQTALDIYREHKDEVGTSDALYNLGVAQINLEQWQEAVKTCQAAMKLFQKLSKLLSICVTTGPNNRISRSRKL